MHGSEIAALQRSIYGHDPNGAASPSIMIPHLRLALAGLRGNSLAGGWVRGIPENEFPGYADSRTASL